MPISISFFALFSVFAAVVIATLLERRRRDQLLRQETSADRRRSNPRAVHIRRPL